MIVLLSFLVFCLLVGVLFSLLGSVYYCHPTRVIVMFKVLVNSLSSLFVGLKGVTSLLLVSLMAFLLFMNVLGNIPLTRTPSIYYFVTVRLSFTFWVSIMVVVSYTQLYDFLAHMLPFGAPTALILFLPLVEVFSHIIRPLTLIIRLRTNLSSGHIIIFMFSFFSVSSNLLTFVISFVLLALLILEFCISALQAYIFTSLLTMYLSETHN